MGSCPPRWRSPDQAPWPPVATDGRPLASPCPAASCGTALPALRLLLVCDSDLRAGLPVSSISLPSPCPLRLQNETPSLEIRSGVGESRPQGASAEAAVSAPVRHAGDGVWSGDPQPPLGRVLGVLQGHPWPPSLGSFPGAPERWRRCCGMLLGARPRCARCLAPSSPSTTDESMWSVSFQGQSVHAGGTVRRPSEGRRQAGAGLEGWSRGASPGGQQGSRRGCPGRTHGCGKKAVGLRRVGTVAPGAWPRPLQSG